MSGRFLGIGFGWWGLACLVVAALFVLFWPSNKVVDQQGLRYLIVRWFHALVWGLLALSCFARMFDPPNTGVANLLALLSLVVYLIFISTLVWR